MSLASLERAIVGSLKTILNNPKFTGTKLLEWSTSKDVVQRNLQEGEVMVEVPEWKCWAAVPKAEDKREVKP